MRIDELEPTPTNAVSLEIPEHLLESVQRHQTHLAALVSSLRGAGVDEATVEASIRALVDSYASELTHAVQKIIEADGCD